MGLSYLNLRNLYQKWNQLQQNPRSTTQEKVWVIFESTLSVTTLALSTASLVSIGYEIKYHKDKEQFDGLMKEGDKCSKEIEKEYENICKKEGIEEVNYEKLDEAITKVFGKEKFNLSSKLHEGLQKNLQAYQKVNFTMACLQGAQLVQSVGKHLVLHSLTAKDFKLTKLILSEGSLTYLSYCKSDCDENLTPESKTRIFCQIINFGNIVSDIREQMRLLEQEVNSGPLKIDGKMFYLYTLPTSLDDPSLSYPPIPQTLEEKLPDYMCPITQAPVARALFIIDQNGFPYLFERRALMEYIFNRKRQGQPLLNPQTNVPFTESHLYESPAWHEHVSGVVAQLQEEKLELKDRKLELKDQKLQLQEEQLQLKDQKLELQEEKLQLQEQELDRLRNILQMQSEM